MDQQARLCEKIDTFLNGQEHISNSGILTEDELKALEEVLQSNSEALKYFQLYKVEKLFKSAGFATPVDQALLATEQVDFNVETYSGTARTNPNNVLDSFFVLPIHSHTVVYYDPKVRQATRAICIMKVQMPDGSHKLQETELDGPSLEQVFPLFNDLEKETVKYVGRPLTADEKREVFSVAVSRWVTINSHKVEYKQIVTDFNQYKSDFEARHEMPLDDVDIKGNSKWMIQDVVVIDNRALKPNGEISTLAEQQRGRSL